MHAAFKTDGMHAVENNVTHTTAVISETIGHIIKTRVIQFTGDLYKQSLSNVPVKDW